MDKDERTLLKARKKAEKEQVDQLLHIDDPMSFFVTKGVRLGPRLGISPQVVRDTAQTLQDAFGSDWLKEQALLRRGGNLVPAPEHPLGIIFHVAGETQVTEACELAHYIRALGDVPRLAQVLGQMKNPPEYQTALMQLGFAFRFKVLGAEDLELEPPVEGGRVGDLAFRLNGNVYIAECYIPRNCPLLPEGIGDLQTVLGSLLEVMNEEPDSHRVLMLRPKKQLEPTERKTVRSATERLLRGMGTASVAQEELELATLEVRRVTAEELSEFLVTHGPDGKPNLYDGAHAMMKSNRVRRDDLGAFHQGKIRQMGGEHKDILLVWSPPPIGPVTTMQEWMDEVARSIEQKIVQTRRADNPRRLVIAAIPEVSDKSTETEEVARALGDRLAGKQHPYYGGVLLVSRQTWYNRHHGWSGYALEGDQEYRLPPATVRELSRLDSRRNILTVAPFWPKEAVTSPILQRGVPQRRTRSGRRQ